MRIGIGIGTSQTRMGPSGPQYGPELLVNRTFDTDTTSWTPLAGITPTVVDGEARVTGWATRGIYQTPPLTIGKTYLLTGDCRVVSGGGDVSLQALTSGFANIAQSATYSGGTAQPLSVQFTSVGTSERVLLRISLAATVGGFDNISLREVL